MSFALCGFFLFGFFALNFIIHNLLLQPRTDMFTLDATRMLKNRRLYCSRDTQKIHLSEVYLIWGLYHKARLMGYEQRWALGQSFQCHTGGSLSGRWNHHGNSFWMKVGYIQRFNFKWDGSLIFSQMFLFTLCFTCVTRNIC